MNLHVSAYVKPVVTASYEYRKQVIYINTEDIERGYIDIPNAVVVHVRTNSRKGYLLSLNIRGNHFNDVWVSDNASLTVISSGKGLIKIPYADSSTENINELSFRLYLSENIQPGQYAWPVALDVSI